MSGIYGFFKASVSQPDLRHHEENDKVQDRVYNNEDLENPQRWYSRLNPLNLISFVKKAWSYQSLQGSEEESDTDVTQDCSKQIDNATIQIVKNDDTCTTDANGIILFTSKETVAKRTELNGNVTQSGINSSFRDFYRFPFRRKSKKPESGDFKQMKKIRDGLLRDEIYFSDDDGTKIIHVQVDIGFIPKAVAMALEKTQLLTTVEIVFQKADKLFEYSDDLCRAVMEFCQKGRCKCKRVITFDVRDEEKYINLREFITSYDEDCLNGEQEIRSKVQRVEGKHTIKLQFRALINKLETRQETEINIHDNDVIKWRHVCEKKMQVIKQKLDDETQCIVTRLDFTSIEAESKIPFPSKNQMKKWRQEIPGVITKVLLNLNVLLYDVNSDIQEEVVDDLVKHEKFKCLPVSVFSDGKMEGLVLCGNENELENVDSIIREIVGQAKEKQETCILSETMSIASYEIIINSDSITNLKTQFTDVEMSYSKSREQLEIHGTHKATQTIRVIISNILQKMFYTQLNISAQQKRLLLFKQTQEFIKQQFRDNGLNSSIEIRKDMNPNSHTEHLKVNILTESERQSAEAIKIVCQSVKKEIFSTRDPKIARLVEGKQWIAIEENLNHGYEGKILIEHNKKIHMINLICTSDIKDEVMTWLTEQMELKPDRKILDLELDKFEYLNKWHRTKLDSFAKALRVAISVKQPYVNTGQNKPMFILEGSGEEIKKVTSFINNDLFRDVITKSLMLTDSFKIQFLAKSDLSVFDYLADSKRCFIRIDIAGSENLIKWTSHCGRQYFVCKGKAHDADVFVRFKQQNTSQASKKKEQSTDCKYEELVIPYNKGVLDKKILHTNLVNMLQRIDKTMSKVLALPMVTKPLCDTNIEELVKLVLDGIQSYININDDFVVEKFYFHELWQDLVFDTVVKALSDHFDDRYSSSVVNNDVDGEDEETMAPRIIFITGKRETVNEINIQNEIQDLIIRQNTTLSRSSSTESVFKNFDTGSIESLTFHLRRPSSEPDIADVGTEGTPEKTAQAMKTDVKGSMDSPSFEDQSSIERFQYVLPAKQDKKSKKKKKMQHTKSTPNLSTLREESHVASIGQPLRKSHDDRLFAGLFEVALRDYSGSIGLIEIKLGNNHEFTGTCFVVNGGHVMSAYHVFKDILDHCKSMRLHQRKKEWNEKVSVIFGFKYIQEKNTLYKYHFHPYPVFTDPDDLDVIILKIETDSRNSALPKPVKLLRSDLPDSIKGITFFGHPRGQPLVVDPQCQIINPKGSNLKNAKQYVQRNFKQHKDCFNGVENEKYIMIHSSEEPGTSGSAGFLIGHPGLKAPTVCCMFLSIYPKFVFNERTGEPRIDFPKKFMIERAVKMNVIFDAVQTYNPQLCSEIFTDDRDIMPMEEG